MRAYRLEKEGDLMGLIEHERAAPVPGPHDIVVRVHAVSLNKRDLFIKNGTYPLAPKGLVIPLSDGAGEVVEVGEQVTRFRLGDRVTGNYFARWKSGPLELDVFDQLGCTLDGMLAEFVLLDEQWAVKVPPHLSWEEAATLTCAGVTAWNCLVGPVPIVAGQSVLTIGTGGVSMFALQFAKALGARVIACTSKGEKVGRLKELGADVVINSSENPEWGANARAATEGRGVDLVVETVGPETIEQSMRAVNMHGQVMLLIARGPDNAGIQISPWTYGSTAATIRRVFVGNRTSFEAMNRAITSNSISPIIDRVFPLSKLHDAFEYFAQGKSFGKVVITLK